MAKRQLKRKEFNPDAMNRNWDLSNEAYAALIESQRKLEAALQTARRHSRLVTILIGQKERERETQD